MKIIKTYVNSDKNVVVFKYTNTVMFSLCLLHKIMQIIHTYFYSQDS